MGPLTDSQRKFAEENHNLIYAFLHRSGCNVNEYYDVAALGFLQAVQRYLTQPALRRYAFPTIAWQSMGREVAKDYRTDQRRRKAELQYLESSSSTAIDLCREAESSLILHEMFAGATPEQYRLARKRLEGYSLKEAAQLQGLQTRQARKLLTDLRQDCTRLIISF